MWKTDLPCNQNTNEKQCSDMFKTMCTKSERSCEEFVNLWSGYAAVNMLELHSGTNALQVWRQEYRTDRTYKTKWTDCRVRIWATCQRKAPCAKNRQEERNHIACSPINIIYMNTKCSLLNKDALSSLNKYNFSIISKNLRIVIFYPVLMHILLLRKYRNINDLW